MRVIFDKAIQTLIKQGKSFSLDYDVEYGVDKKTGWTFTIQGVSSSASLQFLSSSDDAISLALIEYLQGEHPKD